MTTLQASAQKQLRQIVEQIERLEEEKKALAGDIRDKFLEAKGLGFDVKVLRQVVRLRKKSATERQEEDAVLEVYLHALGMLDQIGGASHDAGARPSPKIAQARAIPPAARASARTSDARSSEARRNGLVDIARDREILITPKLCVGADSLPCADQSIYRTPE